MLNNRLWIEKRLHELGKKNYQLADALGIQHNKISQIKAGTYNFQPEHLSTVAEFLKFNKGAFIDFIAGKITYEQLLAIPLVEVSEADLRLITAIKSLATGSDQTQTPQNLPAPPGGKVRE